MGLAALTFPQDLCEQNPKSFTDSKVYLKVHNNNDNILGLSSNPITSFFYGEAELGVEEVHWCYWTGSLKLSPAFWNHRP